MLRKQQTIVVSSKLSFFNNESVELNIVNSLNGLVTLIERAPIIVDTIVIDSEAIQFNSSNLLNLRTTLENPFLSIKDKIVYIIDETLNLDDVNIAFENLNLKFKFKIEQVSAITDDKVKQIISNKLTEESQEVEEITIARLSLSEYLKVEGNLDKLFVDDVPALDDVVKEESTEFAVEVEKPKITYNFIGKNKYALSTAMLYSAFTFNQNESVYIQEFDFMYNYFTNYINVLNIDSDKCYYTDFRSNFKLFTGNSKLKVMLNKRKLEQKIDEALFNFIYSITNYDYYFKALLDKRVYNGAREVLVITPSIPDILESIAILPSDIDLSKLSIICVKSDKADEISNDNVKNILSDIFNATVSVIFIKAQEN